MKHDVHSRARIPAHPGIGNVPLQEIDPIHERRQVLPTPCREVIDYPHCRSSFQEVLNEVGSDEAGSSRYQVEGRGVNMFDK
jgi:hypothetical protein